MKHESDSRMKVSRIFNVKVLFWKAKILFVHGHASLMEKEPSMQSLFTRDVIQMMRPKLELITGLAQMHPIKDLPSIVTDLLVCPKPATKPHSPSYASCCLTKVPTNQSTYLT